MDIIECCFHWYAVSGCNFVKLIGWIAFIEGKSLKEPQEYVKTIIPEVLTWRNKVAAHFAQTFIKSNKRDNIAERKASVGPQICFEMVISALLLLCFLTSIMEKNVHQKI